jgi:hypothetical protein
MNKSSIVLMLMVNLVLSLGCANPDWIQQTLVTAEVGGISIDFGRIGPGKIPASGSLA